MFSLCRRLLIGKKNKKPFVCSQHNERVQKKRLELSKATAYNVEALSMLGLLVCHLVHQVEVIFVSSFASC